MTATTISQTSSRPSIRIGPAPLLSAGRFLLACWPALAATALFLVLIGQQIVKIKGQESGHFTYVLDDAYAHLAIARNLAQHGSWTFNAANGFEFGSSSLLWPVVIAVCFKVFGVHEYFPLVLNILSVVGLLFYAGRALRRVTGSGVLTLLTLAAIVVLTPLPVVVATGMEHSMQALLDLIFVDLAARLLMEPAAAAATARLPRWLCAAGVLVVLARYEGLFLVAAVGLLLVCRRRWKLALTLGTLAVTPVILFGVFAVSRGWYFLPNSLLIKGSVQVAPTLAGILAYVSRWYGAFPDRLYLLVLTIAAVFALVSSLQRRWNIWNYPALVLLCTLITELQHLQFAGLGWFYRYEAYLIVLLLFGLGAALGQDGAKLGARYWRRPAVLTQFAALALAALLVGGPLWTRAAQAEREVSQASGNIYDQHYQMARFVRRFYRNSGVVANDVGLISFLGDQTKLLDTVGLCNIDVLRAKRQDRFDAETVRRLSRAMGAEVAIIYPEWAKLHYGGPLPEWIRVGWWTVPHNLVCGEEEVSFFATSSAQVPKLMSALQQFSPSLPRDVAQDGLYCGAGSINAVGTYGREGTDRGHLYWTNEVAQFDVYPAADQPLNADNTTMQVSVLTISEGETIRVFFNGELVETKVFSLEESRRWINLTVKVRWRAGTNTIRLVGQGTAVQPPGDLRSLLFETLDPRKVLNEAGLPVPQAVVAQGSGK